MLPLQLTVWLVTSAVRSRHTCVNALAVLAHLARNSIVTHELPRQRPFLPDVHAHVASIMPSVVHMGCRQVNAQLLL